MIQEFQSFRARWEKYAKDKQINFLLVSDNNIFDGGFINELIFKHLPTTLPIPYSASTGNYEAFFETHSVQKGFLMAVDPSYQDNWGLSNRISELFDIPEPDKKHDHNPANDAFSIAFEQQVLFAIQEGSIKRRI